MNRVIVIAGPTASGKSDVAIALAKKMGGQIVSADAYQIYRKLDIGTAKIKTSEMAGIQHHLLDIRSVDEPYSVKEYQDDSRQIFESLFSKQITPILCGGTGLYIGAAIYDYQFKEEDDQIRGQIRHSLNAIEQIYGLAYLHSLLLILDPNALRQVDLKNPIRVKSAIEYFILHQESKFNIQREHRYRSFYDIKFFILNWPREILYERIHKRVDKMITGGLLEEADSLKATYGENLRGFQAFKAIGYEEALEHISGLLSKDEMAEKIKQKTRNYAKRQCTWFKKIPHTIEIEMSKEKDASEIAEEILRHLNK